MSSSSPHRISSSAANRGAVVAPPVLAAFRRLDYLLAVLVLLGAFFGASQVLSFEQTSLGQRIVEEYRTPAGLLAAAIAHEIPPEGEVVRSR